VWVEKSAIKSHRRFKTGGGNARAGRFVMIMMLQQYGLDGKRANTNKPEELCQRHDQVDREKE
jgi:hypothetical protein